MASIQQSVGKNQKNSVNDVFVIQMLLNKFLTPGCLPGISPLTVDGLYGTQTGNAIVSFQRSIVGMTSPDCWITPVCGTLTALNGPLKWAVPEQPVAPPISGNQYVRWVKGSLNRLLGCTLLDDGSKNADYRIWVKEFQVNQMLTANGEVNSPTQDALMTRNRFHGDYVAWVQRALNRSGEGDGKLPVSGVWNTETSDVVHDFQINEGLKVDGFVGAKTETALYMRSGCPVPGRLKTLKPYVPVRPDPYVWRDSLSPELRMNVWLNTMMIERSKTGAVDPQIMCLFAKLGKGSAEPHAFAYFTLTTIRQYMRDGWPAPRKIEKIANDARAELVEKTRQMQMRATYAKAWEGFQYFAIQLNLQIIDGLNALTTISNDDYDRHNLNVIDLLKWTKARRTQNWTIQSCYPEP